MFSGWTWLRLITSAAALGGILATASFSSAGAEDRSVGSAKKASSVVSRGATISASAREVGEGDRLILRATIKSAARAVRASLQRRQPPLYAGDDADWLTVKTVGVRARRSVQFATVATQPNLERYRAVVTYKHGKPVTSRPVSVTVWRWIPLSEYAPYYEAEPYAAGFGTTQINGHSYSGWGPRPHSHTGTWEARFTPGRHCKGFRAVLGVADISHDGTSGSIKFTADDTVVYESPVLTPGMEVKMSMPLALPYRFGIQLFDTTASGTPARDDAEAWPVIGDPSLYCTGV